MSQTRRERAAMEALTGFQSALVLAGVSDKILGDAEKKGLEVSIRFGSRGCLRRTTTERNIMLDFVSIRFGSRGCLRRHPHRRRSRPRRKVSIRFGSRGCLRRKKYAPPATAPAPTFQSALVLAGVSDWTISSS